MEARDERGGRRAAARGSPRTAVEAQRWYDAPCAAVFAAWIEPALVRRWLFATAARPFARAVVVARPGGALRLLTHDGVAAVTGCIDDARPPARLRITLDEGPARRTTIVASLSHAGGGTTLRVRHDNVAAHRAGWLDDRWTGMLYGLGEALDCDSHELSHDLEWR